MRWRLLLLTLSVTLACRDVLAQGAEEPAAEATPVGNEEAAEAGAEGEGESDESEGSPSDDDTAGSDDASNAPGPEGEDEDEDEEEGEGAPRNLTPLPWPGPTDQTPGPYVPPPEPESPMRRLVLGAEGGVALRSASGGSYDPGLAVGGSVRIPLARWMGIRGQYVLTRQGVGVGSDAVTPSASSVRQSDVVVHHLGLRIEPTLPLSDRARAWLGVGVAWNRLEARALRVDGHRILDRRTGSMLDYPFELGGSVDVVEHRLAVSLRLGAAPASTRHGDYFETVRAPDASGALRDLAPLPRIEATYVALLGMGLVL